MEVNYIEKPQILPHDADSCDVINALSILHLQFYTIINVES